MKENVKVMLAKQDDDYQQSAWILTVNDPWAKLGRTYEYSYNKVREEEGKLIVAKTGEKIVGCLLLEMHSTLKAFVRALCVSAEYRQQRIGADLLKFAEQIAFKKTANVFLFVSSKRAQQFYERNGSVQVGDLTNLNVTGTDEHLMRKTIGPNDEIKFNGMEIVVIDGDETTLEDAIKAAGKVLFAKGFIKEKYVEKCIEREKKYPTGLPTSIPIAIPHTDAKYVNRNFLCFQRMKNSVLAVEIGSTKQLACSMVINMGVTGEGNQVTVLSKLIEMLQDEEYVKTCIFESKERVKQKVEDSLRD